MKLFGLTGGGGGWGVRTGSRDEGLQIGRGETIGGAQNGGGGGWLLWEGACGDNQEPFGGLDPNSLTTCPGRLSEPRARHPD